jgi:hypothetical protein
MHRTTSRRPVELFEEEERAALKSLPPVPHPCSAIRPAVANSCCRITVATNRYSIPPQFASSRLLVHCYTERIIVFAPDGRLVADHPRSFARHREIVDPSHLQALKHLAWISHTPSLDKRDIVV